MNDFRDVIDELGAPSLAAEINVPLWSVQKWRQRNSIPSHHWLDVLASARTRRLSLSAHRLAEMAADRGRG